MQPIPAPAPVRAGALLDLAVLVRKHIEEGGLGADSALLVAAALERCFPGDTPTVESCPCEPDPDAEPGRRKCDECPTRAELAVIDDRLSAILADLPRPPVVLGTLPEAGGGWSLAAQDVLDERARQITGEGFTIADDDRARGFVLAAAAAHYTAAAALALWLGSKDYPAKPIAGMPIRWPWDLAWWKPTTPRRMLVKAAALILAQIERLDRAEAPPPAPRSGDTADMLARIAAESAPR